MCLIKTPTSHFRDAGYFSDMNEVKPSMNVVGENMYPSLYRDLGNNHANLCFKGLSQNGVSVAPLHNFTYRWTVPKHIGPTSSDPPCLTWMYSSAANPIKDPSSGLVGPLVICKPGALDDSNKQVKGVFLPRSYQVLCFLVEKGSISKTLGTIMKTNVQ